MNADELRQQALDTREAYLETMDIAGKTSTKSETLRLGLDIVVLACAVHYVGDVLLALNETLREGK